MGRLSKNVMLLLLPLVLAVSLAAGLAAPVSADEVVNFPDPNLETNIRIRINKPEGDIYQSELVNLTYLSPVYRGISDLTGLEHCTSLTRLSLATNQISDISPLANLTSLIGLSLYNNQVSDISPLANLTSLTHLLLYNNQVSDISSLANLTSLTHLELNNNQISDISPLANLTSLIGLSLYNNQVSDISSLANLTSLEELYLGSNQISDISSLANLTSLIGLSLYNNQVSDISPLVQNEGLGAGDRVDLRSNPLSCESFNIYIPQLQARGVNVRYDIPPNQPPVANAGGPYTSDEGSEITFDASASSDPDCDALQYRWDFENDGTWDTNWSSEPTATYTWDDDYTGTVKLEVSDGALTDSATASVTVNNVPPTVGDITAPVEPVAVNMEINVNADFTDSGTLDTHTGVWNWGDGTPATTVDPATSPVDASHTYTAAGVYTVTLTVTDDDTGSGTSTFEYVVVINTPDGTDVEVAVDGNTITFGEVTTGGDTLVTTSSTGPLIPTSFKLGAPPIYFDFSTTATYNPPVIVCIDYSGIQFGNEGQLRLWQWSGAGWVDVTTSVDTANDIICGQTSSLSIFAIVEPNQLPIAQASIDPYVAPVGSDFAFAGSASYDPDGTIVSYDWDFGDGNSDSGVSVTHTYSAIGLYDVVLTVTDDIGAQSTDSVMAVVYDPDAGFVTGGGWIYSDAGADRMNPSAEGKATFGFVSKYKRGATEPTGQTEFRFKAGDLNFHSTEYAWLVVNQAGTNAQFKGEGTINGTGEYKFMLWAGDDDPDTFRIRIWEEDEYGNEVERYDNGFDQTIAGGSIVIHTTNK